jgi:hypothetical protein
MKTLYELYFFEIFLILELNEEIVNTRRNFNKLFSLKLSSMWL